MLPALLLAACSSAFTGTQPEYPTPSDHGDDTAETTDTGMDVEIVPSNDSEDQAASRLFGLTKVHSLDVTISDESLAALADDPYEYVPADIVLDGVPAPDVGLRNKGRVGSYRPFSGKPSLKIEIGHYQKGRELLGIQKLNVNSMVQDYAMAHDYIAYSVYNAAGVQAPRVGFLWVTINGEDYGLYANIEAYDDVWLERRYEDPDGNLYDGDYYYDWTTGSYTMIDFSSSLQSLFELDEGEDVGLSDISAVTAAVESSAGTDAWTQSVGAVVDLDQFTHMWAGEAWVGQYDGYAYNRNNYRVYFDPTDGLARMHPWDHDWAFYSATPITTPSGVLAYYCKLDTDCHETFLAALDDVRQAADATDLEAQLDRIIELTRPYVEADPRKEYDADTVATYREDLRTWIQTRSDTLAATDGM